MEDKFKDIFHDKLYDYEANPKPSDWEAIAKRLPTAEPKRPLIWLWRSVASVAAVAAIALLFVVLYPKTENNAENNLAQTNTSSNNATNDNSSVNSTTIDSTAIDNKVDKNVDDEKAIKEVDKKQAAKTPVSIDKTFTQKSKSYIVEEQNVNEDKTKENYSVIEKTDVEKKEFISQNETTPKQNIINAENEVNSNTNLIAATSKENENVEEKTVKNELKNESKLTEIEQQKNSETFANNNKTENKPNTNLNTNTSTEKDKNKDNKGRFYWEEYPDEKQVTAKKNGGWSLALAANQSFSNKNSKSNYMNVSAPYAAADRNIYTMQTMAEAINVSHTRNSNVKLKHKFPISFGIKVQKNITPKLAVKTGLQYTYLMSDYKSSQLKVEQKVHYIGIPIEAEYTIWSSNRFAAYVSAGGTIEKGVNFHYTERTASIADEKYSIDEKGSVGRLQFSVTGNAGFSYDIIKNLGVYVEPNVSYFIKDSSQPTTVRTEKPFSFGVNVGVKVKLNK